MVGSVKLKGFIVFRIFNIVILLYNNVYIYREIYIYIERYI